MRIVKHLISTIKTVWCLCFLVQGDVFISVYNQFHFLVSMYQGLFACDWCIDPSGSAYCFSGVCSWGNKGKRLSLSVGQNSIYFPGESVGMGYKSEKAESYCSCIRLSCQNSQHCQAYEVSSVSVKDGVHYAYRHTYIFHWHICANCILFSYKFKISVQIAVYKSSVWSVIALHSLKGSSRNFCFLNFLGAG